MNPPPTRAKVVLSRLVKLLLLCGMALYVIVCALMGLFQRSFIYHPSVFSREQDAMARRATLERWTNSSAQFIGMKRLSPKQPAQATVLITYGNAGTAIGCDHYAKDIQGVAAMDVFILEYPGFADRPGRPTQQDLFSAAGEAFLTISTKKPIYVVGESLGSGVASYLAGTYTNKIAGLLLISPFNKLAAAAQYHYPILPVPLLLRDRFPSEEYLRNYGGKVGITVDGQDRVVPPKLAYRLHQEYAGPKKLWEFPKGTHCQITERTSIFWKEVVEFWQG